ncbi:MAG: hypothetical protein MK179_05855 [Pirellulaceae bacterium]|nr:hypothetical protein [Pirellulaceae bacterium]
MEGPASASTTVQVGFNITAHVRTLCADVTTRLPQMSHIDMRRVAVAFCQARKRVSHGMYASLTPLRFEAGSLYSMRGGRRYTCQRLYDPDGNEYLYVLSIYLPRFMDCPFKEKLVTVFHELWHISPLFDGDIRRFEGRCHVHSQSQKEYDDHMECLVDDWLERSPSEHLYHFLSYRFDELNKRHGPICGTKIPHPKLILA